MGRKENLLKRLIGGADKLEEVFEVEWQKGKDDETRLLYNDIVGVLEDHKPSWQNVTAVLELIRWSYLRAYYMQQIEGTVKIPKDSVPLKKKTK